jgi:CheY-like chemotaxis protein
LPRASRVLLADDEPGMRLAMRETLAPLEGVEILEAADGAEALRLIDEQAPDVVLLDLLMPEMTGIDVLTVLKERGDATRTPKIVVLSALVAPYLIEHLEQLGATRVVAKPFHPDEFLRIVEALVMEP